MKTWWCLLSLAAAACAARQSPPPLPQPWTLAETAKLRGQCLARFADSGQAAPAVDAVCRCFVSRFTEAFPRTWLDDGQPVKQAEVESISRMVLTCRSGLAGADEDQASAEADWTAI